MSAASKADQARVMVVVAAEPAVAFDVFVHEIDQWWRQGLKYRVAGQRRGVVHLEGKVGGRLFETFETEGAQTIAQTGTVLAYEPPRLLRLEWRNQNFAPHERTIVSVEFAPTRSGTRVTLTHSGWSTLRPDHPALHGERPAAHMRSIGLWWGEQMTSLRRLCERDG